RFQLQLTTQYCPPISTRRFVTRSVDWSQFCTLIDRCAHRWRRALEQVTCKADIDRITADITSDIILTSERALPLLKQRKHTVPWWSTDLTRLRRVAKRWKKRCVRARCNALIESYLPIWRMHQNRYEDAILKAKKESWRHFLTAQ